jgi:NurA-like 5'-3' nuclease
MLNSLYEKAIAKRGLNFDIEPTADIESQLEHKWFNRTTGESLDDFSIAAGDGSFNKKKFLTTNFCAVGAESIIYDGEIKKIDDSDIFDIPHVSFLDELLSNYMAIYELKCALRALNDYHVDYYMIDGSILGDLQNAFPRGAKLPSKIKDNLDDTILHEFERLFEIRKYGLVFPEIRDSFKLFDLPSRQEDVNKLDEYNLQLASVEKIILLKELLQYRKKIISISKTSSENDLFHWNIPDIAFLDKFTKKQGMTIIKYKSVYEKAPFPYFNDFFKNITFTIFYVRFQDNKNVLKVELPYKATKEDVFEIIKKINV